MYDSTQLGNGMTTGLVPCLHPLSVVRNGERVLVPCGSCSKCISTRLNIQTGLTNRLFSVFRYCIFVTLTYTEENVPKFSFIESNGKYHIYFLNREIKQFSPLYMLDTLENYEVDSIKAIWSDPKFKYRTKEYVRYIHKEDYQLFVKRVFRYVAKNFPQSKITYVGCTEYGEQYLRPHIHLLFFANEIECVFGLLKFFKNKERDKTDRCKRWPYGHVDAKLVRDTNVSSYVSGYVSCNNSTPAVLRRKEFRGKFFHAQMAGTFPLKQVAEEVRTLPVPAFVESIVSDSVDDTERVRRWSDFCKFFRRFSDIDFANRYGFTSFLGCLKRMLQEAEGSDDSLSKYCHRYARKICREFSRMNFCDKNLLTTYYTSGISLTYLASYGHAIFDERTNEAFQTLFGRIYHSLLVYRHFRAFCIPGISADEVSQIKRMYETCTQIVDSYRLHGQYAKLSQLDDPILIDNYFKYYNDIDLSVFDDSQVYISYYDNLIAQKDKSKKINEPTLFNN